MLVTFIRYVGVMFSQCIKSVTNSSHLSPTHSVSNIRHQHRCNWYISSAFEYRILKHDLGWFIRPWSMETWFMESKSARLEIFFNRCMTDGIIMLYKLVFFIILVYADMMRFSNPSHKKTSNISNITLWPRYCNDNLVEFHFRWLKV